MQSLVNKVDLVLSILFDNNIGIACIAETWFSGQSNTTTSIIKNSGYNISHNFRGKRGGGVAIIWKKELDKQVRNIAAIKSFDSFQYQNIIFNGKFKLNLICLYRFQEVNPFELFLQELNTLLSFQDPRFPILLTGDFNVHYQLSDSKKVKDLAFLTSSYGLSQFVLEPTNIHGNTIDLIFANSHDFNLENTHPVDYNVGDHFPIFFELPNISKTVPAQKEVITFRNTKSLNVPDFSSKLVTSLDSALSDSGDSFSDMLNVFNNTVKSEFDIVAPQETRTLVTSTSPPWMDWDYRNNRRTRRSLERKWKRSRLPKDKRAYFKQMHLCAKMSDGKRAKHHSNIIASKKGDVRGLFQVVNNIFDKNTSTGTLPLYDDAKELANSFNKFYIEKVEDLRCKIPLTDTVTDSAQSDFNGIIMDAFRPTTETELGKILKNSGIKTSFNDILPAKVLKQVIDSLLPYFCTLVNKSLSTGSVDGMKESIVIPLLKKAGVDSEILKNYRPVADLVFLSKLTERVVLSRLDSHMTANNLHCHYEHGYKKYHSTETLLLRLHNDLLLASDKDIVTILLLIDLSAAFDTVDIDLLLHILEVDIGISGVALQWFASFLRGRNQRVLIKNSVSDSLNVNYGVPQGSVLGPVLFNIYIRSLFDIIAQSGFSTSGYADDNNAYRSFAMHFQYDIISTQLPKLMTKIKQWMHRHFLKINPDKTEIICFRPDKPNFLPLINGTFLEGDCIRFADFVKNLGFILDKFLTMEPQVNATVAYCYKLISDVARERHLLSDSDTESLMHAIVSSRLDYCNILLYGVNKCILNKYQMVQNAAARVIAKLKKHQSVRETLKKLHWLPVEQRIVFKMLVLTFKIIHGLAPDCLSSLINVRCPTTYILKNVYLDSKYGRRSFTYAAPRYWNALPSAVRTATSVESFKQRTKFHLFNHFNSLKSAAFMYQ